MLARDFRLRQEKDIKTLFARGKSVFGLTLGLKLRPNKERVSRFGFSVGLKVSKSAVARNQLKRRLRAIVHAHLSEIGSGYDVMVIGRKEALNKTYEELEKELVSLFVKAGLCR